MLEPADGMGASKNIACGLDEPSHDVRQSPIEQLDLDCLERRWAGDGRVVLVPGEPA
jgi:hypothetical protein